MVGDGDIVGDVDGDGDGDTDPDTVADTDCEGDDDTDVVSDDDGDDANTISALDDDGDGDADREACDELDGDDDGAGSEDGDGDTDGVAAVTFATVLESPGVYPSAYGTGTVSSVSVLFVAKLPDCEPRVVFGFEYRENSHTMLDPSYSSGVVRVSGSQPEFLVSAYVKSAAEMNVSFKCSVRLWKNMNTVRAQAQQTTTTHTHPSTPVSQCFTRPERLDGHTDCGNGSVNSVSLVDPHFRVTLNAFSLGGCVTLNSTTVMGAPMGTPATPSSAALYMNWNAECGTDVFNSAGGDDMSSDATSSSYVADATVAGAVKDPRSGLENTNAAVIHEPTDGDRTEMWVTASNLDFTAGPCSGKGASGNSSDTL